MNTISILLFAVLIIFCIKNVILIKDLSISKKFKKLYQGILEKDPEINNKIEEYIKEEKNEYLLSKSYVLLMYVKLMEDADVKDIVEKIDVEKIFLKNGKYNKTNVNLNSDIIIWILCSLPRLNKQNDLSILKDKMDKLNASLSNHIEYKVFNAVYALLNNDKDNSIFLDDLVNGNYSGLDYDKQLIGVTKRVALSYIASQNKEKNIEYAEELKIFSETMLGKNLLKDLEIYEIYK